MNKGLLQQVDAGLLELKNVIMNREKARNSKERTLNEGDLLSVNNPVGRTVKILFNEAALELDNNWHPQDGEYFPEFKTRLLNMILEDSPNGLSLRNLVVSMYRGNKLWSLR